MSEQAGRDPYRARYELVQQQLAARVGDANTRLSDPEQRFSVGDVRAAALTYGEIVLRGKPNPDTNPSPDLIPGASRCVDDEVNLTLLESHLRSIDQYLDLYANHSATPDELAGHHVSELSDVASYFGITGPDNNTLHPRVEGYGWYRGYFVSPEENDAVIIFKPWMVPSEAGGSPTPVIYTLGNPEIEVVRQIAAAYAEHATSLPEAA